MKNPTNINDNKNTIHIIMDSIFLAFNILNKFNNKQSI